MKQYRDVTRMIHKDGYIPIIVGFIVMFVLGSFAKWLGWFSFAMVCFVAYFFRNPDRVTPAHDDLVISPADGIIVNIVKTHPPAELNIEREMQRVSIFLSPLDVHVNRVPVNGKVSGLSYHPGRFINASMDKASVHNERQTVLIETKNGHKVIVVQIAGMIARRIVCDLEENAEVQVGNRYGIIRFGSRVDVYIPLGIKLLVSVGQRMVGGESVIANLENNNLNCQFEYVAS